MDEKSTGWDENCIPYAEVWKIVADHLRMTGASGDTMLRKLKELNASTLALRAGPGDDGEPITAQWAYLCGVRWLGWAYDKKNGKDIVAFIDKPDGTTLEIKTRGELRRLCAALGIDLTGDGENR